MEGFDSTSLPYMANPLGLSNVGTSDFPNFLPSIDLQGPTGLYDTGDFGSTDRTSFMPPSLPSKHSQSYSNPYDESFADNVAASEADPQESGVTSIDRDNKLLSFNLPTYSFELLNWSLQRTSLSLKAQLHGMFFIAETPSGVDVDTHAPSAELTCYRRNLFQVTGLIRLPRALRYIVTDQGHRIPILAQELTISATESGEGLTVKVITVPWKTPAANASSTPEDRVEKEPPSIPLDTMSNQDMDADYATFPIAWKRLQFRTATNNNGRRRELQQHYVVRLKVVATLSTGMKLPICEAASGAIIVRGRSPRNFERKNELPVGNAANNSRRTANLSRSSTQENVNPKSSSMKGEKSPNLGSNSFTFGNNGLQAPNTFSEALPTARSNPATPTRTGSATAASRNIATAPVKLSLVDDSDRPGRSFKSPRTNITSTSDEAPIFQQPSAPSSANLLSNPDSGLDAADLLYEYFPLGLDNWMPPVDAVYRPHVVHHLQARVGSVIGQPGMSGRSKRYFSDDQS